MSVSVLLSVSVSLIVSFCLSLSFFCVYFRLFRLPYGHFRHSRSRFQSVFVCHNFVSPPFIYSTSVCLCHDFTQERFESITETLSLCLCLSPHPLSLQQGLTTILVKKVFEFKSSLCLYLYLCLSVCLSVSLSLSHTHTHTNTRTHARTHARTQTHTHTHTHTHSLTHTHLSLIHI